MKISKSKITSSVVQASAGRILYFTCPVCHNKAVVDIDNEVYRDIDMGYHDRCICEECGQEFLSEPQYRGDPKFVTIDDDNDIYSSTKDDSHYKDGYRYITKHGLGPGTLPKDVHLLHAEDLPNWKTAIWLDRFLTTDELKYYDIYPESIQSSRVLGAYGDSVKAIRDAIWDSARAFMMSPEEGFPEDEIDDYLFIDIDEQGEYYRIEVRAELNYDGMFELCQTLNSVVAQYDPDAYFDMDEPGIASAYLSKSSIGAATNSSNIMAAEEDVVDLSEYEYCGNKEGYQVYRKIVYDADGKHHGEWAAQDQDRKHPPFKISYMQALGYAPIDKYDSDIKKLSRDLGKMLLPNSSINVMSSTELGFNEWLLQEYGITSDDMTDDDYDLAYADYQQYLRSCESIDSSVTAAKQPKYWNTTFRNNVIEAYKNGELSFDNIDEWEIEYNGGVKPSPSYGSVTGSYGIENARILHIAKTPEPELRDRNSVWIQVKDDHDLETYFRTGLRMEPDIIVIHDFDVDEIPGGLLTLARSAEIPVKFASKRESVGAATNTSNVLSSEDEVESASYGGAFDIEDDMFFTREEINEFGYDIADLFSAWADSTFDLSDVYMDSPTKLHIEVSNKEYEEYSADVKIDMRRIRSPRDLYKYEDGVLNQLKDAYLEYHAEDEEDDGSVEPIQSAENLSDIFIDGEDVIVAYDRYYVPDQPLEPPYEPELPIGEDTEIVNVTLDDNVTILEDGTWKYSVDDQPSPIYHKVLGIPDSSFYNDNLESDKYSQLILDDDSSLMEHVDDIINDSLPMDPGVYHVVADIDLCYDIEYPDINEYNEDDWDRYDTSDWYKAEFNYYESKLNDIRFEKLT